MLIIDGRNYINVGSVKVSSKGFTLNWCVSDKPIIEIYPDEHALNSAIKRTNRYYLVSKEQYKRPEYELQRIAHEVIRLHQQN